MSLLAACMVLVVMVGGCTVHRTPDGHGLWSGSRTGSVRSELGPPDLVIEGRVQGAGGSSIQTKYFYLDRGYMVWFVDGWVRGVFEFRENEREDLERSSAAYKNEVPKVQIGWSAAELLAALGTPEYVKVGVLKDDEPQFMRYGAYGGEFERKAPPECVEGLWKERYIRVLVQDGVVKSVGALNELDWKFAFGARKSNAELSEQRVK